MKTDLAEKVVDKMLSNDAFSKWLGIELLTIQEGHCRLGMVVRSEMLNGFEIAHGAISYALADSALAFSSNSRGIKSLSIETAISHIHPVAEGDYLIAESSEIEVSNKIGRYQVQIKNQHDLLVANFSGTVFRTGKSWF